MDVRAVSAEELCDRARRPGYSTSLSAGELERWLVVAGFATRTPEGLLAPTDAAVAIAGTLAQLEGSWRDTPRRPRASARRAASPVHNGH